MSKRNDYQRFIIICHPRSGSTLMHSSLNYHPNIICVGDAKAKTILNEKAPFDLELIEIFSNTTSVDLPGQIKAIGVKAFYEHLDEKEWKPFWNEVTKIDNIKVIHLFREDQQKAFESYAKSLKRYSKKQMELAVGDYPDNFNNEFENKFYSQLERGKWMVEALFDEENVLPITYEDLIKKRGEVFLKIQEFLQVPNKELYSPLKRIRTY